MAKLEAIQKELEELRRMVRPSWYLAIPALKKALIKYFSCGPGTKRTPITKAQFDDAKKYCADSYTIRPRKFFESEKTITVQTISEDKNVSNEKNIRKFPKQKIVPAIIEKSKEDENEKISRITENINRDFEDEIIGWYD